MKPLPVAASLLVGALLATPARAQSNAALAQGLFDEGMKLLKASQYAEACPKLEESQRLDPGIGTLFNLADCYEHVGRLASAWAHFLDVAAAAKAAGQGAREEVARGRAVALEPRLARLSIQVDQAIAGLEIRRDGIVVGKGQWNTPLPLDPGPHAVSASAPGRAPWTGQALLSEEGRTVTLVIPDLLPAEQRPTAAGPGPSRPVVAPSGLGAQRTVALVAGGVGLVGLGLGSFMGLRAIALKDESSSCEGQPTCSPDLVQKRQDSLDAGTSSTVAFVAGGALLAGGIVLWLTAPRAAAAPVSTGVRVVPLPGGISAVGRF